MRPKKIAHRMVRDWGMGQKLYHESEQREAETEINRLLANADREALVLIGKHREKTALLAKALLVQETLTRDEVLELFQPWAHAAEESSAVNS